MPHRKTLALGQDFANPAAMANLPISFIAQQATRRDLGDGSSLPQRQLGFGASKLLLDDAPEPIPLAAPVGEAALRRRPERCQMNIAHPGLLDRRGELAFRKAGPPRDRPVPHIDERPDADRGEGGDYVLEHSFLVADGVDRVSGHWLR